MDIKDMPNYNSEIKNEVDSVSQGKVTWTRHKATCHEHIAMLCVSKDRKIWRCPECHVGCYVELDEGDLVYWKGKDNKYYGFESR